MNQITERIKAFNSSKIPEMVRYKYEFMRENNFRFFRGTNHIFYEDLGKDKSFPIRRTHGFAAIFIWKISAHTKVITGRCILI